jgi:hypothetical protein
MREFRITKVYRPCTLGYRLHKDGVKQLGTKTGNSFAEVLHKTMQEQEDQNYFPQDDESIQDCDGVTIFEMGDTCIELGDYVYEAEEI